jgi:helix-turn-helix protein
MAKTTDERKEQWQNYNKAHPKNTFQLGNEIRKFISSEAKKRKMSQSEFLRAIIEPIMNPSVVSSNPIITTTTNNQEHELLKILIQIFFENEIQADLTDEEFELVQKIAGEING